MKNVKSLLLVLLCVLFITGCGEKTIKCTNKISAEGVEYTADYEIVQKDDTHVKSVKTKEVIISSDSDYLQSTKDSLEQTYGASNKQYGGYSCKVTVEKDKLTSDCTVDYEKMDLKKFVEDNPSAKIFIDDDYKATIEGVKKTYEQLGAKCEE